MELCGHFRYSAMVSKLGFEKDKKQKCINLGLQSALKNQNKEISAQAVPIQQR